MKAKLAPALTIVQFPETMELLRTSFPGTLLRKSSALTHMHVLKTHQIDNLSASSGAVAMSEQKYSSPLGLISNGVMMPTPEQPTASQ